MCRMWVECLDWEMDAIRAELRRIRKRADAASLNRPGFWGCVNCTSHNPETELECRVCGAVRGCVTV